MSHETSVNFTTGYMDCAVDDLSAICEQARIDLARTGVDFDTIVGTGFSGGIVIPMLATLLGKKWVLIRKEGDDSHHGPGRLLGHLGERWLFVDDFVSTGRTYRRVVKKINEASVGHYRGPFRTDHVGAYQYAIRIEHTADHPRFIPYAPETNVYGLQFLEVD